MLQREFQVNLDYKERYCPKRGGRDKSEKVIDCLEYARENITH